MVEQPAARNSAPCRHIFPNSTLPSASMNVTPVRSTTSLPLAEFLNSFQTRSNSSTQGPTSRPSKASVCDELSEEERGVIFNMSSSLSQLFEHDRRACR